MAYGVIAHHTHNANHQFPQSATFSGLSSSGAPQPPLARMYNGNTASPNVGVNPNAYATPAQYNNQNQVPFVHLTPTSGLSGSPMDRSNGGAHVHSGQSGTPLSTRSPPGGNALPYSHSADMRYPMMAYQQQPSTPPARAQPQFVQTQQMYAQQPQHGQRQGHAGSASVRAGTPPPQMYGAGAATTAPMNAPPPSPPVTTPAGPPRLNHVTSPQGALHPNQPTPPRPYSAPPTPTPINQGGAVSASGASGDSEGQNGRQKSKSGWIGKIFKKIQHHAEDSNLHLPHPHRRREEAQPQQQARTAGAAGQARARTPPAGRRNNGDRDREAARTGRNRSSNPRSTGDTGPRTANRRSTSPDSLCEFFMKGDCPNGRLCPYKHPGEDTLHGCSPRTIARTIRRACRDNEGGSSTGNGGSNRDEASGRGTGGAASSDQQRAARRRHSTGGSGDPQGGSSVESGAASAATRTKRENPGLGENEIEMLPSFPFRPLTEAEEAEDDHRPTECHICYEDFEEGVEVRALPCFHMFHANCVGQWLKKHKTCPFCQNEVKLEGGEE